MRATQPFLSIHHLLLSEEKMITLKTKKLPSE